MGSFSRTGIKRASPALSPSLAWIAAALLPAALALAGCELAEKTIVQPEDHLVAESYALVGDGRDQVFTFLHWTEGTAPSVDLEDASVHMTGEDGNVLHLPVAPLSQCLGEILDVAPGVCFAPPGVDGGEGRFAPGETVSVQISLPDGRSLSGQTTIPGDYSPSRCPFSEPCLIPPFTTVEVSWSRSSGAWAYASATRIFGIRDALAPMGLEVAQDPLSIIGLSVSEADTTIVFPRDYLLIKSASLGQELVNALTNGLPAGVSSEISVAALDPNYVNWLRVEAFKPSARIRVPSLRGDGTGVFGSAVRRTFQVNVVGGL